MTPTPSRRRPADALDVHEAFRISEHARIGHLDLTDADIARVVSDANQLVVRSQLWGEVPVNQSRRRRRLLAVGLSVLIGVCTLTVVATAAHG